MFTSKEVCSALSAQMSCGARGGIGILAALALMGFVGRRDASGRVVRALRFGVAKVLY